MAKKIVDARADEKGNIQSVRFEGNSGFTLLKAAVRMADRGEIENAHAVHPKDGQSYLRTNPDSSQGNNLDEMAGDK